MKLFIINVKDCLTRSHYEPFFYEHIAAGNLSVLDGIDDTSQLDVSCRQILEEMNQRPFSFDEGFVLLLIPRDFSRTLAPREYELYNDINAYMQLVRKLPDNFRVCTLYVDKTGQDTFNDSAYNPLRAVSNDLCSSDPALCGHFLCLSDIASQSGDYRRYLAEKAETLCPCTAAFYKHVLTLVPEIEAEGVNFRNAVNHYIGEAKDLLSGVNHAYAQILRNDVSEDIRVNLRVVYYIKHLASGKLTLSNMPKYEELDAPDYTHIQRLLATYRVRLSRWYHEPCPISKQASCATWNFTPKSSVCSDFKGELNKIISEQLSNLSVNSSGKLSVVSEVFDKLDKIVSDARERLERFAHQQSQELHNPANYTSAEREVFQLVDLPVEDEMRERRQLEQMNLHSPHTLPEFSDENKLHQELDRINTRLQQTAKKLEACNRTTFFLCLLSGLIAVAGLYIGSHISVFVAENSWWVCGLYLLTNLVLFSAGYFSLRNSYVRQMNNQLSDCKRQVEKYLDCFASIADEFDHNLQAAGDYNCLMRKLQEKESARKRYQDDISRYSWHMTKVSQILQNFTYFEHFSQKVLPYEEESIGIENYDHDAEHTEFYQVKRF